MKNVITYILILLVSIACSHRTIEYFSDAIGYSSIEWIEDFNSDESNSESKKSDEKNEKKDFSEYLFSNKSRIALIINQLLINQGSKTVIPCSDYSLTVYSPPENTI